MDRIRAQHLAPLIPVAPNQQIFQYRIVVDASFDGGATVYEGGVKVNKNGLPYQMYKAVYKAGSKSSIGFNVFQAGVDINYQPFWWTGAPPPNGQLVSDPEQWCFAGPVTVLDRNKLQEAMVQVAPYPWLSCKVKPVLCSFDLDVMSSSVATNDPLTSKEIVSTRTYTNTQDEPVTFSPVISYEKTQTASVSLTDRHAFEAGVNLHVEQSFDYFAGETTFALDFSFNYGYTHETTAATQDSVLYRFDEPCEFTLDKDESAQVTLTVEADWHTTANIEVELVLSGKINGEALDSAYLKDLVVAQSPVEIKEDSYRILYKVQGLVEANVVHNASVTVNPI